MAGVPATVELSDEFNAKAQEAALLMSKNIRIDHFPPSGWSCYTEDAAEAASNSNLLLGTHGPSAVARYMLDPGGENYFVGHRRWLLHPQTQEMGTGDVPRRGFMPAANAIWVFDGRTFDPRPDTRDEYIAWPPAGFVPNSVVYPRWSFSLPNADFRQASVTVSLDGTEVPVNIEPVRDGFGDPTLVWHFNEHIGGNRDLENDLTARVSIDGIRQGGNSRRYEYDVTIFDPATPSFGSSLTPTPPIIDVAPAPPTCAGSDLNGDGRISFTDFLLLSENFGTENVAGDVDCDGQVNFDDFLLFTRDFRRLGEADSLTRVTNTVPEPSPTSLANLCVVLVSLLVGRHRMQRLLVRLRKYGSINSKHAPRLHAHVRLFDQA